MTRRQYAPKRAVRVSLQELGGAAAPRELERAAEAKGIDPRATQRVIRRALEDQVLQVLDDGRVQEREGRRLRCRTKTARGRSRKRTS